MFKSWPVAAGLLNLPSLWGWFCVLLVSVFGFHLILEDRPRSVTDEHLITHHITEDFVGSWALHSTHKPMAAGDLLQKSHTRGAPWREQSQVLAVQRIRREII